MGKGGRAVGVEEAISPVERAPSSRPPFTVGDLKRAIPPHCFKRSIPRSFSYLIFDLVIISIAVYCTKFFVYDGLLNWAVWIAYWVVTGCVATGVWVIAHECGHHAFSDYQWLDDTVGLIFHSLLLVPYFSWKYSHRRHHSNTGSVEKDEVFVPKVKEEFGGIGRYLQHPPGRLIQIIVTLTMGWPMYLIWNVSGRKYDRPASHFNTHSPIFVDRERFFVFISDISLLAVAGLLYKLYSAFGLAYLINMYAIPLLIVNGFLVLITYLQHTHAALPHYDSREWDWLRGALATMDRDYGILNHVMHHITDTHVAHHLFSTMPHYHASEATEAIKPILGKYYQMDRTPVPLALWREFRECVYVESENQDGVLWYKNKVE
ncbi:delta(12)-acyl-lipid-desaturase [Physcomitrium patens]|uniref:Fatty acid desaturase domain-containing protein n=1 Tax=Physcomitrium patens TaxID=3218 RepID=A9RV06_PHYPA|nr:delta(12)-acyl-lipid-desaturase-like [Physcomitrium patens]XP_024368751.1 delta(12)-acyl-lipid-desaturase-like [Physcomitrium patens]XP_024368752.1 delta(12)-acyl-lipid-desaturase-like [Physcomitrium patens]PNR59873.1 hypothetical protein PHYPA_002665 [Physcomitrium patens]|eukprot:XP_024368750.1 delta(12)-acyl-lipid-desaturase-like [Physcomitrella patens]